MTEFLYWLESTELAFQVGATWWFPLLHSLHILSAVFVVGAILMVDLRLMGLAARRYPLNSLLREHLPWCWFAFAIVIITGALLFMVQASNYLNNTAFLAKLVLLGLVGTNMLFFHWRAPTANTDNPNHPLSLAAKVNGGLSLLLWCGVMLAGRWIGHVA